MSDHYECMEAMEMLKDELKDELKLALRQRDELAEAAKALKHAIRYALTKKIKSAIEKVDKALSRLGKEGV